jgi:hypothetical protein
MGGVELNFLGRKASRPVESSPMAQAHHFLDEGRFLLLVEACEQWLRRIGDAALVHRALRNWPSLRSAR